MYAIVDIAGQQFKVAKSRSVITPRLEGEVGSQVEFDKVLFLSADDEAKIGTPYVDGAKIQATILAHNKAKKITVFKKKRRKGYHVLRGHRQQQTKIKIDDILS
jgi:large subunit ribosomal protein L21